MDGTLRTRLMAVMEENGNSVSTQTLYIRNIEKLYEKMLPNMKRPSIFKNLNFLRDTEEVEKALEEYAENTKKSYLTSIVVVIKADGIEKKPAKKAYDYWYDRMMKMADTLKKVDTTKLTPTQQENWMDWEDIVEIYNKLKKQVVDINWLTVAKTKATDILIKDLMVLSLYVNIQPRRNQDYTEMVFQMGGHCYGLEDQNILDLDKQQFVFNCFKTAKKIGQQIIDIPDVLWEDIKTYLAYFNRIDTVENKPKHGNWFLTEKDGDTHKEFNVNTITRTLNRVLGKKIGCSMLRHIYLSNKYGDTLTEQQIDADAMAHSTGTQKSYIKKQKLDINGKPYIPFIGATMDTGDYQPSTPSETTKHDPLNLQINGVLINGNLLP